MKLPGMHGEVHMVCPIDTAELTLPISFACSGSSSTGIDYLKLCLTDNVDSSAIVESYSYRIDLHMSWQLLRFITFSITQLQTIPFPPIGKH